MKNAVAVTIVAQDNDIKILAAISTIVSTFASKLGVVSNMIDPGLVQQVTTLQCSMSIVDGFSQGLVVGNT